MTIAVTTPTGNVGSRVVQLLVQAGERPLLLVRDAGRLDPALRPFVDVVEGDLLDEEFVLLATKDADRLFWATPENFRSADPLAEMIQMGANAAAAVRANGIARVVQVSSVGAERGHGVGLIDGLARNEEQLAGAGLRTLRCGYYFTNLLGSLDRLRAGALSTALPPEMPMAWVDPRDVGEVAAARLLAGPVGAGVQAVHGPADLTWVEVARILSAVLGREIRVETVSDEESRASLARSGMSAKAVDGVVGMTTGLRDGFTPEQTREYRTTTPTTLAAWAYANLKPRLA